MFSSSSNNGGSGSAAAGSAQGSEFVFVYPNPPDLYCCPITHTLMTDPVIDIEGNTYERKAIEEWLKINKASPITRSKMELGDLKPNRTLRSVIEAWKKEAEAQQTRAAAKEEEKQNAEYTYEPTKNYTVEVTEAQSSLNTEEPESKDLLVLAQVRPPKDCQRPPADIVCVIDVSGSMGSGVTIKNGKGVEEQTALTILDVTKHAVRTVMEVLGPNDRLSLVKYSTEAHVVCPLLKMDKVGKTKAMLALKNMSPTASTNLWDGLFKGMEVVRTRKAAEQSRLSHVMLLTDGQPNIAPPRGHIPMLQRYVESNPNFNATVSTYGFGYNLDSKLLDSIAAEMNGLYAFIPDSGFVGTIFVNSIANVLSTGARNATLKFEVDTDAYELLGAVGMDNQIQKTSWGAQMRIGDLSADNTRSILVRLKAKVPQKTAGNGHEKKALRSVTMEYSPVNSTKRVCATASNPVCGSSAEASIAREFSRLKLFALARKVIHLKSATGAGASDKLSLAHDRLVKFGKFLESTAAASTDKYGAALLEDFNGQMLMGLQPKFYRKWGMHFLLSLTRAHMLQQCLNFKDPGVQFYGGKLFQSLRDKADDLFNKLPPPKPSRNPNSIRNCRSMASMSSLNNRYAGCFDGEGKVLLANGTFKPVKELEKGDEVSCRNGLDAKVVCIIRTTMADGHCEMVELKTGVKLTAWHPVHLSGEWQFPNDLGELKLHKTPFIYNAILDQGHSLNINGIDCVTLGHHLKENKVVEHPYFGTDRVVDDFKQMPGWNKGFIQMAQGYTIRDETTGLVCGMNQGNAIAESD
eukprot:g6222.t1